MRLTDVNMDVNTVLEREVLNAYYQIMDTLSSYEVAPQLYEIYEAFYYNILGNIEDVYEEVFGEGTKLVPDRVQDLGIDIKNIPDILVVCKILNAFKLGYIYKNTLYNSIPQSILKVGDLYE